MERQADGCDFVGALGGFHAQAVGDGVGPDEDARVHDALRVEEQFEFFEDGAHFGAVHGVQQG